MADSGGKVQGGFGGLANLLALSDTVHTMSKHNFREQFEGAEKDVFQ